MKDVIVLLLICFVAFSMSCEKDPVNNPTEIKPVDVTKTNPTKMWMHVMPWFHSKEVSGYWGSHWRMNNKNPETILPNGQRQIASHYYPLIGPYDSSDPDVVDYHLLLMKYAGIDGLLIDWYGSHNVLDYGTNLTNTNAIIEGVKRTGLEFAVVYEDNTADEVDRRKTITALEAAQQDMTYAQQHYFSTDEYIRIGEKPLLLTFGPRFFITPDKWTDIFSGLPDKPSFIPLWNHAHRVGDNGIGQYSWVDFTSSLSELEAFHNKTNVGVKIGSAFPGFHDFYAQGGWGTSYGFVDHANGTSFQNTLAKAREHNLPYLQLVTWNDFGEGTIIEPTVEFQYTYLEMLQEYTGVTYKKEDLELIHTYYLKRKEHKGNTVNEEKLDEVFDALIQLKNTTAKELLQKL